MTTKFVSTTAGDPTGLQAQLRLDRERQLAEMLQGQALAPIQYEPAGGISWTQGAAKMLAGYLSGRQQRRVADAEAGVADAARQRRERQQGAVDAFRQAVAPVSAGSDASGNMVPGRPRTPQERDAALAELLSTTVGPEAVAQLEMARATNASQESFGAPQVMLGQDGQPVYVQAGTRGTVRPVQGFQPTPEQAGVPSSQREWDAFSRMTADEQARFLEMRRAPYQTVQDVAGVPTLVTGAQGPRAAATLPLSTLPAEAGAAATTAAATAGAETTARADAERAASTQKRGGDAERTLVTLDLAEPLIDVATGSAVGAGADRLAQFFGGAPDGARAIAALRVLEANLMTSMPRMEGPQSDRDVELYRQAAAQLGDPTVPRDLKRSALKTIRDLQGKYRDQAAAARAAGSGSAGPTPQFRFNPQTQQLELVNAGR